MRSFAIASGSSGNSIYIESSNGVKVLVDLGISYQRTKQVLEERDIDIKSIDSIFITHEHSDHVAHLESFLQNLDCKVYLTKGTLDALKIISDKFEFVKNHSIVNIDDLKVLVLDKSHDAKEPVHFVFDDGKKLGVFTDFGEVYDEHLHILKNLDFVYFEANYCEEMIKYRNGEFNTYYIQRTISNVGHLGLNQAVDAITDFCNDSQKIVLSHISENTNSYENTYIKISNALKSIGKQPQILVSFQGEPTPWIE